MRYGGNWGYFCTNKILIERLFFTASFLALVYNSGKLIGIEANHFYLDLDVVKEQAFILFMLCLFIATMEETKYRQQVLACLKVLLFVFTAGGIAKRRK